MLYYLYLEPGQAKILKRFGIDHGAPAVFTTLRDALFALINLEAGEQSRSMHFWLGEEGNNHQPDWSMGQ